MTEIDPGMEHDAENRILREEIESLRSECRRYERRIGVLNETIINLLNQIGNLEKEEEGKCTDSYQDTAGRMKSGTARPAGQRSMKGSETAQQNAGNAGTGSAW